MKIDREIGINNNKCTHLKIKQLIDRLFANLQIKNLKILKINNFRIDLNLMKIYKALQK
jgi:hypothetical protein